METFVKTWFKGMQRGCLIRILAVVIGLPLACCLLSVGLYLVALIDPSNDMSLVFLLLCVCAGSLFMAALGLAPAGLSVYYRHKRLSEVFAPLGLTGGLYALTGHQFHGQVRGRRVDVYISRGPNLRFYVEAEAGTRLAVALQDQVIHGLTNLFNNEPLQDDWAAGQGLVLFARDAAWGRAFAADPVAQESLPGLLRGKHQFVFRQLHIRPDAVYLNLWQSQKMFGFDLHLEQVSAWLDLLLVLAETVERLPAPIEKLTASPLEIRLRKGDQK